MKRKNKKCKTAMIDLNSRINIEIVHSTHKKVTDKEMEEFESRSKRRYNAYCEFTELCIKKNTEKNSKQISHQVFIETMRNTYEQNALLKDMIKLKE